MYSAFNILRGGGLRKFSLVWKNYRISNLFHGILAGYITVKQGGGVGNAL